MALVTFLVSVTFLPAQSPVAAKYISPNNDGIQDYLIVNFTIKDKRYISEWRLIIEDSGGSRVRVISNKEDRPQAMGFVEFWKALFTPKRSVAVPRFVAWDGLGFNGSVVPDGTYTYYMTAKNDNGIANQSERYVVVVDCTPPAISVRPPADSDKFFGAGAKAELRIGQQGSPANMPDDLWTGIFTDARGVVSKIFTWQQNPQDLRWDGSNNEGTPTADGLYSYVVTGVDLAGNRSLPVRINNIVYSGDRPAINISVSGSRYFSNNPASAHKTITLVPSVPAPPAGNTLQSWRMELVDNEGRGKVVKVWPEDAFSSQVPATITLNGTDGAGRALADGAYIARLSATYLNGYTSPQAASPRFFLKSLPPAGVITVREPKNRVFSPGGGSGKDLIIFDEVLEPTNTSWRAEIRRKDGALVRAFERGAGRNDKIPQPSFWDGFNEQGRLCEDGEYTYAVYSTDLSGNRSNVTPMSFTIDTQKTELVVRTASPAFSPNGDGVQDVITITPFIKSSGVEAYNLEIKNTENRVVKTLTGTGAPPESFTWDGRDNQGITAADNRYTATLSIVSRNSAAAITASTAPFL
ncbi:MAG: hypothetical protein LBD20_07455, partial [Spirochaetaceae bacterium]|nr:hypothetical protein [Spirochaetaceae bacterium]